MQLENSHFRKWSDDWRRNCASVRKRGKSLFNVTLVIVVFLFFPSNLCFLCRLSSGSSGRSPIKTIMIQDDSLPAAPPPQIRILKRPTSNGSLGPSVTQSRPSPQVKSLAQREAEYAEARKRILGSADDTLQERPASER